MADLPSHVHKKLTVAGFKLTHIYMHTYIHTDTDIKQSLYMADLPSQVYKKLTDAGFVITPDQARTLVGHLKDGDAEALPEMNMKQILSAIAHVVRGTQPLVAPLRSAMVSMVMKLCAHEDEYMPDTMIAVLNAGFVPCIVKRMDVDVLKWSQPPVDGLSAYGEIMMMESNRCYALSNITEACTLQPHAPAMLGHMLDVGAAEEMIDAFKKWFQIGCFAQVDDMVCRFCFALRVLLEYAREKPSNFPCSPAITQAVDAIG
jgi:hypothetical protein